MEKGRFIVFEGIDGCGKGTQIKLFSSYLFDLSKRMHILSTREPTELSKAGINIRKLLAKKNQINNGKYFTEQYVKDRKFHIEKIVLPILKVGGIVLSDRYMFSTFAYQLTQGMDFKILKRMHKGLPKPDLTCIIDITPEEAMKRLNKAKSKKEIFENSTFLSMVRKNYLKMKDMFPDQNIVVVDGMQSVDAVFEEIKKEVNKIL